jgi:hypothetical protein
MIALTNPRFEERIRNGHQRNYGCWNKFKIDPSYTEDQYWNDVIAQGSILIEQLECRG